MSTLLQPGDTCAGHQILRHIGTGRSAEIYTARLPSGAPGALKLMRAPGAEKQQARFGQEGEILAQIVHPNVIRVYGAGVWQGRVWISLELFEGQTLTEWLLTANPSVDDILHVFQQICDGLAEAHRLGIIHRDLCPENILIGPGGMVKVIDFGMAKLIAYGVVTTSDQQIGAARYMSPEHARSEPANPRMDVYSVGLLLYESLAGHPMGPEPRNLMGTLKWQLRERPRPIREVAPWVPFGLAALVDRMCAKDPALRPESMLEIHALLREERAHLRAPQLRAARNAAPISRPVAFAPTVPMSAMPDMVAPEAPADQERERAPLLPAAPVHNGGYAPKPPAQPANLPAQSARDPAASTDVRATDVPVESAVRRSRVAPRRTAAAVVIGMGIVVTAAGAAAWMFIGRVTGPFSEMPAEPRPAAPPPLPTASAAAPSTSASAAKPAPTAAVRARTPPKLPAKTPAKR